MNSNPWTRYFQAIKQKDLNLRDEQRARFSRAHARLRIAQSFLNINLSDVSSSTERGYSTAMAIFLAYSGMEALANAMDQQPSHWHLEEPILANRLKKLLGGLNLSHADQHEGIAWLLSNQKLLRRLQKFQENKNHNVLLIAQSLRHMVAHGSFTTHGLKMFTKRECDAVEQLRQRIFLFCDERMNQWVDQQL
jgi:hypothetical protein